jgi:dienelactone hydrolase
MISGRSVGLVLLVALVSATVRGADGPGSFVGEILGRRIIGPDLGLAEIRMFAEAKVPRMPEIRDQADWLKHAERMRADTLSQVVYRGEAARWRDLPTRVEWQETISGGPGYRIKKLRYEAVPGFWVPALLYEPEKLEGKVPAVLNFDGHDAEGMFAAYKQIRCINLAKRGMIALNVDWIGMGQLRSPENQHGLLNHLDLCGTSGEAVFYSLQTRGVDVLLSLDHVQPSMIAATGLSGGGWQTIFLGALDPRVALTVPVAGYSSFLTRSRYASDLGDSEQTPVDLATVTDYALMTAMLAPRAALLTFNAKDNCCFAADHAPGPLVEAATPIYRLFGREAHLRTHVNHDPGTHNYLKDNREALYKMLRDEFFPGRADYQWEEIASDSEVKTAAELKVALPPDQASLHSLSLDLAKDLPRDRVLPTEKTAALAWQADRRERLARVTRSHAYVIRPEAAGNETRDGILASLWKLRMDGSWTIPAVELSKGKPRGTMILLVDAGRKEGTSVAEALLASGQRVVAVDPFDQGESKIAEKGWLWNLFASSVGERPLGLASSQVAAVARWTSASSPEIGPASIVAIGPNSSLIALVAASLEPKAIGDLDLRDSLPSLKSRLTTKAVFESSPLPFCFGLLEVADIPELIALAAPRRVQLRTPGPETAGSRPDLKSWYALFGVDFNPLP